MVIKTPLIKLLRRLGYEIFASSKIAPSNMSRLLQVVFEKLDIDCILDVGAHVGEYADFLRKGVGYNGLIISFEPVEGSIDLLRGKSKDDPRWEVYGFALGAEDAEKPINVMHATALSSFLEPDHSNTDLVSTHHEIHHRQTVKLRRIDSIIDDLRNGHEMKRMFVKLDTQGYDFQVILGAERTLTS
jgi:FkbM family methyltransferase